MQNHLDLHNFDHDDRVSRVEHERLVQEARKEAQVNTKPNAVMMNIGKALVEVGEQMQAQAKPQPQRSRSRA